MVIAAFSDLGCRYCAQWATETLPQLGRYAEDGTVRIEWHDFPVTGPDAAEITQARELGAVLGLTGAAAFVVGEESRSGAQPVEAFTALIEQQAARV